MTSTAPKDLTIIALDAVLYDTLAHGSPQLDDVVAAIDTFSFGKYHHSDRLAAAEWAMANQQNAAVYPVGTIVATSDTVYIKDGGEPSGEPSLPWRDATLAHMYVNHSSDEGVSCLLADGDAEVLRVGERLHAELARELEAAS